MAEYLKLKSFIVVYNLKDEEVLDKNAVKICQRSLKLMKPLNDFLNTPFLCEFVQSMVLFYEMVRIDKFYKSKRGNS
jgi:hypothetical protein